MNVFNQFDNLRIDWDSIIKEALLPFEGKIVELIESQQHTGKDGYGVDFNTGKSFVLPRSGAYSSPYARRRGKKGLQTNTKDFHDTGAYHEALKVLFFDKKAEIHSTDYKSPYIEEIYGEEVVKLSYENINELLDSGGRDAIINKFRKKTLRSA